jgi:alpha-glucosidase (family GH31 glycosyl hydrolase)
MWQAWERRETGFYWESLKKRDHMKDQGTDGIRMDLGEIGWGCVVNSIGSGLGPVAGCCECGDKPSGFGTTELVS